MSPDDLRELLLERLLQNAPGIKGNNLSNVILGAKWKPWYSRAWDYTRMGWNIISRQYIWDGETLFKNLYRF